MSNNENTKKIDIQGPQQKRKAFPRKPVYIIAILLLGILTGAFLVMLILTDILPPDITVILAAAAVALLLFTNFMISSRYRWKRIVGIAIGLIFVLVLGSVTGFMKSTFETMNKISQDFSDQEKGVEAVACIYEIIGKLSTADSKLYMLKSETEKLINSLN